MPDLNGVDITDTFAEAFSMTATRLVITAATQEWAQTAATQLCGYATSVIACDCEAGVESIASPDETPDGRPGVNVLAFAFNKKSLASAMAARVGQCVLTCATTACYSGLLDQPRDQQISVGGAIRYFGDGFQSSKKLGARRYWRIPVMDGEFVCEDRFGTAKGVGGGNLLLCGVDQAQTLTAAEAAVAAIREVPDVILPFPGGIVRSGSKVGSKYKALKASTNDAYCPTLRAQTESHVPDECNAVYEIVVDGLSFDAVQSALRAGLHAACHSPGLKHVTAGNYGGKLGKHHFHLRELL
ncbi:MAG: formylmethanofuran--tetrahydromethanopterin N-formyltransferase [Planctomycetota bacterium]|nr:MAG: formylmethanofuran--tetrahydromethanopterin N-formyltransferase [Planctomycetota bacterium]REJ90927.1 MAG: formylmethanofuran--tetrahydromethanopterin N-formyltransferase [Planctomycetota bacterium]REK20879.1 MAG: formylmethanofuran--tetrahydromethanopterin N-formyltransferase [Planctomycetota bacterium]REK32789.1 MAG: formylmethanofuran--tetrahydromethanopterin N-formyltransferase [Planctomycetota bacterium]